MALPTNDHHVHSDGYTSEKGEPDQMRMMEELADEIEQIIGVESVWPENGPEGPYIEVEYDGDHETYVECEDTAVEWNCGVVSDSMNLIEIRPD
jgi:hypothetical protein